MNPENSKTPDPHRLLLFHSDKMNLKGVMNILLHQTVASTIHKKNKNSYKKEFKYQLQSVMINLNYLIGHILYQIFKNLLNISSKNMKQ